MSLRAVAASGAFFATHPTVAPPDATPLDLTLLADEFLLWGRLGRLCRCGLDFYLDAVLNPGHDVVDDHVLLDTSPNRSRTLHVL